MSEANEPYDAIEEIKQIIQDSQRFRHLASNPNINTPQVTIHINMSQELQSDALAAMRDAIDDHTKGK